ncbi:MULTISPECIES: helix-turn-helix domain-containing protein [Paenibacillus]|uniref:helix-turn-helix domain-containing protein n=1 Tax=Paenibacillus TaxID=44249 RepID=UPI0022B8B481|nr:helix-turn-helix transcriptional regulator [Paenibacillus caseinilyticus]MCZ8522109.1 helix-turn-helix transcriptional regulator [Paenibacillus caseinilyticus]
MLLYNLLTPEEIQALVQPPIEGSQPLAAPPPGFYGCGQSIRAIRERKGWSSAEAASRTALPPDLLRAWEQGEAAPNLTQLLQLSEGFRVSVDELLLSSRFPAASEGRPPARIPEGTASLADRLTYLRTSRRLTRSEAAAEMGFSYSELTSYERGYRLPELQAFLALVHYYHTSAHLLLTGSASAPDRPEAATSMNMLELLEGPLFYKDVPLGPAIKQRISDLLQGYELAMKQAPPPPPDK